MKQNALKGIMLAKRKITRTLGYRPGKSISLERHERPCLVSNEKIETYSDSSFIEIYDPRSESLKGHYFQNRSVYRVKNIILEPKQGLVYSSSGELIEESTNWPIFQLYNSFPWNPKKNVAHLHLESAIFLPSSAFWHWLIEDLPLAIFALGTNPSSPLLIARNPPKYVSDFLKTLDREVIFLDGPVKIDSLILVGKCQDAGWPHPKDLEVVRNYGPFVQVKQLNSVQKRIYISRRASKRSPKNEVEIEELFQSHDFEILRLEDFNLVDEIRMMSGVSYIAGVHGAGMANMIWMPKKSKLLDIANDNYWTESVHRAAYLKEIGYNHFIYSGELTGKVSIKGLAQKLANI